MQTKITDPFTRAAVAVLILTLIPMIIMISVALTPGANALPPMLRFERAIIAMLVLAVGLWRRSPLALWLAMLGCVVLSGYLGVAFLGNLTITRADLIRWVQSPTGALHRAGGTVGLVLLPLVGCARLWRMRALLDQPRS